MKTFAEMGVQIPEILLPENLDVKTWSVVACDQYTQDRDYWKNVEKTAAGKPSSLNIILPEVYLNDADKPARIEKIRKTMSEYMNGGVFAAPEKEFVYVERTTAYGRVRQALIRATEATIVDRIPPRMEIRRGAPLELPHIMLLVNDPEHSLVEETGNRVKKNSPLYSGDLMQNSGSISGWKVSADSDVEYVRSAMEKLAEKNTSSDGSVFLFAVGDGNHSLATAKAVWDEYKASYPEDTESSVRYALVEIVNIYDTGLTFEPIHRVLFNVDSNDLVEKMALKLGGKVTSVKSETELEEAVKNIDKA